MIIFWISVVPPPMLVSLESRSARSRPAAVSSQSGSCRRTLGWKALVNAAVHRSYSIAGDHVRVEIFDDRIEVESPGRFPGLVDPKDPLHATRFARNPQIARVCADLSLGQELGEGIRRMFEEMRFAGLADPLYRQGSASVRLTLSGVPVDRELEARLPPASLEVLAALREAGRLGTGDLLQVLGVTRPVAIRRLERLQELELIEWVGNSPKDPRAYWQLRRETLYIVVKRGRTGPRRCRPGAARWLT